MTNTEANELIDFIIATGNMLKYDIDIRFSANRENNKTNEISFTSIVFSSIYTIKHIDKIPLELGKLIAMNRLKVELQQHGRYRNNAINTRR